MSFARDMLLRSFVAATVLGGILPREADAAGFVENRGQLDPGVSYQAALPGITVFMLRDGGILLDLPAGPPGEPGAGTDAARARRRCALRIVPEDASPAAGFQAREPLRARHHYCLGRDPGAWRADVPAFAELVQPGAFHGLDLVWRLEDGGLRFESPRSGAGAGGYPAFRIEGAELILETAAGREIRTAAGVVMLEGGTAGTSPGAPRSGAFHRPEFRRAAGRRPPAGPRDDFALEWSTCFGGGSLDWAHAMTTDPSGNVILAGSTLSPDLPTTIGAYDRELNGSDAFLAAMDATGSSLLWCTFLGGSSDDRPEGVAIAPGGAVVVTGYTASADFPTTPGAYDTALAGALDAFVATLDATGSALLSSTYLGGASIELGKAVAVDAAGDIICAGLSRSPDFPVTPDAADPSHNGGDDAFLAKLDASGRELRWSTYLGGREADSGDALALGPGGAVYLAGRTASGDFPAVPAGAGGVDAFAARYEGASGALRWTRLLGGSADESLHAIALAAGGRCLLAGSTGSADFPTTPLAWDRQLGGLRDAYVAALDEEGGEPLWSTYLGGEGEDEVRALTVNADGDPFVAGETRSADFPTTSGALARDSAGGGQDFFVSRLDASGEHLAWSACLGGTSDEWVRGLRLDGWGRPVIGGFTTSSDYPTTPGAFAERPPGYGDVFLSCLAPAGLATVGPEPPGIAEIPVLSLRPNPAAGAVTVEVRLRAPAEVSLELWDVGGRRAAVLFRGPLAAGRQEISAALDAPGTALTGGIYFLRLAADGRRYTRKLALLR